ncbi:MAG: IS110 family transposase [Hymenobacter sp.]|nr:MAG: IS110 family transposase [Hymenobacter sp.]
MYTHFIGVDISKDTLDIAVVSPQQVLLYEERIANKKSAIISFFKQLRRLVPDFAPASALVCMEHTGLYNRPLLNAVPALALPAWVEHAAQINAATGIRRGKTDAVDARRIAAYAARFVDRVRLYQAPRPVLVELDRLQARRQRLVGVLQVLQTPLSSSEGFFSAAEQQAEKRGCAASLQAVRADLKAVEAAMAALVADDAALTRQYERLTSVPGVGLVTAVEMLLTTNEFEENSDPKRYASYAGVVPFERSSGQFKGRPRVSPQANKRVKTLLHLAALAAVRFAPTLKAYYERKVAEGKNKMLVLNNVRNKLVHLLFACVQQDRNYDKNYTPALV